MSGPEASRVILQPVQLFGVMDPFNTLPVPYAGPLQVSLSEHTGVALSLSAVDATAGRLSRDVD